MWKAVPERLGIGRPHAPIRSPSNKTSPAEEPPYDSVRLKSCYCQTNANRSARHATVVRPPNQVVSTTDTSLHAVRYKVVCKRPLCVRSEVDERKGGPICDLMPGERVWVLDSRAEARPDGSVRCPIVDPVWMGWLTLTTMDGLADTNDESKCEQSRQAARGGAASIRDDET